MFGEFRRSCHIDIYGVHSASLGRGQLENLFQDKTINENHSYVNQSRLADRVAQVEFFNTDFPRVFVMLTGVLFEAVLLKMKRH